MSPPPKRAPRPTAPVASESGPPQRPETASDFRFPRDIDHGAKYDDDEALARRLQEEEDALAAAQRENFRRHAPSATPTRAVHGYALRSGPSSGPRVDRPISVEGDELYARRLAQELHDAEIAMGLQTREQERIPRGQAFEPAPKSACSCRRLCNCALLAVFAGGGVVLIMLFGSTLWKKAADNLPPFLPDNWGNGHDLGTDSNSTSFSKWRTKGNNGLKLTITNALTSDWWSFFDLAVSNWDNGTPDALTLTTVTASSPDPDCQPIRGEMKVCNNKYGDTGWTGINEVYFEGGVITSSVAKMNEYYLSGSDDDLKHYVMCHEIGHGFGLPHRDENVDNKDLGTCLDYTRRPQANLSPDGTDYQNLADMYGIVESGRRTLKDSGVAAADALKGRLGISAASSSDRKNNDSARKDVNDLQMEPLRSLSQMNFSYQEGRLLHSSEYGEMYETDLGDGAKVVTRVLFSSWRVHNE